MAELMAELDDLLPTAKEMAQRVAQAEADEAVRAMKAREKAEAEKKALLAQFAKPSGVSDELRMKRAAKIIERAVADRKTEVEVYRFPNDFCTDKGRAINQGEAGWPETLTGLPREIFEFWNKYLRDKGYKLHAQIVSFPNGMPGDVGMTLKWG